MNETRQQLRTKIENAIESWNGSVSMEDIPVQLSFDESIEFIKWISELVSEISSRYQECSHQDDDILNKIDLVSHVSEFLHESLDQSYFDAGEMYVHLYSPCGEDVNTCYGTIDYGSIEFKITAKSAVIRGDTTIDQTSILTIAYEFPIGCLFEGFDPEYDTVSRLSYCDNRGVNISALYDDKCAAISKSSKEILACTENYMSKVEICSTIDHIIGDYLVS